MKARLAIPLLVLVLGTPAAGADRAAAPEATRPQLKMEEIEVRGSRETPDRLFLPAPPEVSVPAGTRYDLFLADLGRPIFPRPTRSGNAADGGTCDDADAID